LSDLPMLESGCSRAGTIGRIAALIATLLAVVVVFASVAAVKANTSELPTPADQGPMGASIECGGVDSLPFAKLADEGAGEGSSDGESDKKIFEDAAISHVGAIEFALLWRLTVPWERPPRDRVRAGLGAVGARGPPVG
jgi:hypothetical protein